MELEVILDAGGQGSISGRLRILGRDSIARGS